MASQLISFRSLCLAAVLALLMFQAGASGHSRLLRALKKSDVPGAESSKSSIAVPPAKAQEFLGRLSRTKRNIWDRTRPDVQQWIMQFRMMGYDEQRLEADLSYWMDQARSTDQGRQHHYDENAPIGPRDPGSYRHGANVNYDYY
ncbi:augurin-A [Synchiropus splendidus]|uniref:augurin-A n=1 Tax=Synchiropus splendidus TaxID=270530 RepID=UPI00237DEA6B|nr:augurin-A [Synchiropus splendidus]